METIWIGIGLVGFTAVGLAPAWRRSAAGARTSPAKGAVPRRASVAPPPPAPALPPAEVPAALSDFQPRLLDELPAERRAGYLQVFRDVPRPPRLIQHLLSPEFFDGASSAQLVDLISAEPLTAARVLATVNSPFYGLSRPVAGIGQAVTLLGLNAVRSLCVQHILRASFLPDCAERKRLLERTWAASTMASELAQRLSATLGLEERGALVSAVVLSFLGRLAVVAHTPLPILDAIPSRDLLARTRAEQDKLGLPAAEIGRLLMTEWQLPASVVADAADLDRCLVAVPAAGARGVRLALGYLCARLGERMAHGELSDLAAFDAAAGDDAECFHLRAQLRAPALAGLPVRLQAPDLLQAVQRLRSALRV